MKPGPRSVRLRPSRWAEMLSITRKQCVVEIPSVKQMPGGPLRNGFDYSTLLSLPLTPHPFQHLFETSGTIMESAILVIALVATAATKAPGHE